MKRDRRARQIGLTSAIKTKRPGSAYYRGGSDPNKGKKKRWWYEVVCSLCGRRNKIEPTTKAKCFCGWKEENGNRGKDY